eukprot:scaffold90085_cov36-Phaeocystis_antarctica.AAC.1
MEGVSRGGVLDSPVRVAESLELGRRSVIAEADVASAVDVSEDTFRRVKELGSRTTHGSTKHARGEGDVWASVG